MDGRGRIVEPLNGGRARARRRPADLSIGWRWRLRRWSRPLFEFQLPRGVGFAAAALFMLASAGYGMVHGGQIAMAVAELKEARDTAANALGFRIAAIALAGQHQLTREEIFVAAGVSARSSLLFFDAAAARAQLKTSPWIAEATVLKLYPGRLHIAITERAAFALWQQDGKVAVIADDGVVLEPYVTPKFAALPLVVGRGADGKARDFLALIDRHPTIRAQLYASVLVAERRWNLKLKNGIDVRLPEFEIERALDTLAQLARDKKLLARDIVAIDLRLPDRVTVRLSDEAAAAREDALKEKDKKVKRKGGDA